MDDYITGVDQVGVDPTVAVEAAAPVDTQEKADPATDVYEFKEYDLKEYDNKALEKPYEYGDYGDYGTGDAKPTSATYDDEFGPGVPAETDFRESSVSAGVVLVMVGEEGGGGGIMEVVVRNVERWRRCWWHLLMGCLQCPFLFVVSVGIGL